MYETMQVAEVGAGGLVRISEATRQQLGIVEGDKIEFKKADRTAVRDKAMAALKKVQEAFAGETERLGLKDEDDLFAMLDEIRQEVFEEWKERSEQYEDNA
ncbi:MAG: AbrB/MazE/SpoVT family DNA-binding domain-containing protein [Oscillospiraceae bacterium]|jgi:bifunctional DNA-binding transcriptional regulator/antitoxin component of YhaV-PrlF toxin-antitoxin module|nr:AbrB/MazE/SpoVT family DNA-binding domain-containing protein [Oscillospiraceae bacterium]